MPCFIKIFTKYYLVTRLVKLAPALLGSLQSYALVTSLVKLVLTLFKSSQNYYHVTSIVKLGQGQAVLRSPQSYYI